MAPGGRGEDDGDHARTRTAASRAGRPPTASAAGSAAARPGSRRSPPAISRPIVLDGRRPRLHLAGDRALVHHRDAVGERQDLVQVLADQEDRDARRRPPRAGTRARSRSRRRRGRGSARRRSARAARRRTRARGRASGGCRRRGRAPASRSRRLARRSGRSGRGPLADRPCRSSGRARPAAR